MDGRHEHQNYPSSWSDDHGCIMEYCKAQKTPKEDDKCFYYSEYCELHACETGICVNLVRCSDTGNVGYSRNCMTYC